MQADREISEKMDTEIFDFSYNLTEGEGHPNWHQNVKLTLRLSSYQV